MSEQSSAWQQVWQTLADHQWGRWECSCGVQADYEDNHLADVLIDVIADRERAAEVRAWDNGYSCGLGDCGKGNNETVAMNPYRRIETEERQ